METNDTRLTPVAIEDEMRKSYLDYSMSVIVGRALPDVRDGLKPVHRRVLYAMSELGMAHNKPFKKSARVVGDVIGKYHPHGDVAVYDTLVRMAQDFSLRYPLVDGQGNFGSIDGDPAAAMRYTECRMTALGEALLADLEKDTVDFGPNYDDSTTEPLVLPAAFPNLLVNGTSGIAVGMATSMPPHNLTEAIVSILHLIDNPTATLRDLLDPKAGGTLAGGIQGPDFPTAGFISGREGIRAAYETGRGIIHMRARHEIEVDKKTGRETIAVSEIPYMINKAKLIVQIAELVKDKRIEGISDIRDESDRRGMRIVIELKRDAIGAIVVNNLFAHSQLEASFAVTNLSIDAGQPIIMTLKQMLERFVAHRVDVVERRTRFELRQAKAREHILIGYEIALDHLDEIIALIRAAKSRDEAKADLMRLYAMSEIQSKAVLEMQLQRLTGLERDKIRQELAEVQALVARLSAILASDALLRGVIKDELTQIKTKFGDARRTEIVGDVADLSDEDLIAEEDMVVTVSHLGYVKRNPTSLYRAQRRGGKGKTGAGSADDDFIEQLFVASTHAYLLVFTNMGRVYWVKVHALPQAGRAARGKAIVNLIAFQPGEKMAAILPVKDLVPSAIADELESKEEEVTDEVEASGETMPVDEVALGTTLENEAIRSGEKMLVFVTKKGIIKRTLLSAFANPRNAGLKALAIDESDELVSVRLAEGGEDVLIGTAEGMSIRFAQNRVRAMGRTARGVKGITLSSGDCVVGAELAHVGSTILTVTENGYGKRTTLDEYRLTGRGGKGVIDIKTEGRNGKVVATVQVADNDEVMLITNLGMLIRTKASAINVIGRNTQGVRLMDVRGAGEKVVGLAKLPESDDDGTAGPLDDEDEGGEQV